MLSGLLALSLGASAEGTSHLDSVIQQGQLRVCTTGDYKPYTSKGEDGEYAGIDIAMARSLADSLGVKVEWVPTKHTVAFTLDDVIAEDASPDNGLATESSEA